MVADEAAPLPGQRGATPVCEGGVGDCRSGGPSPRQLLVLCGLGALLAASVSLNLRLLQVPGSTEVSGQSGGAIGFGVEPADWSVRELSSSEGKEQKVHQYDAYVFLVFALLCGTALLHLSKVLAVAGLQQSVVLFSMGVALSLLLEAAHLKEHLGTAGVSYDMWMAIDPHMLLFSLLPVLLMGDAMMIDTNVAKRVASQCLFLAGPGVLINALVIAGFLMLYLGWSFHLSLTVGSIFGATDPVAVVALLKELGASPTLTVQLQGESLLNDGTAIVLYTVAYDMLRGEEYYLSDIITVLAKSACMGWLFGMFVGYSFFLWIRSNHNLEENSSMIQISLTLCCAYVSYVVAEGVFGMSGVLSTVAASLMLAHNMWPFVTHRHTMMHMWHCFEFLGNTLIFFLAGALVGKAMVEISAVDYLHLFVIYAVLIVVRATLIFASRPLLKFLSEDGKAPTLSESLVMTWGGLRGAVGLALAIAVHIDRAKGQDGVERIDADTGRRVVFFVGGVALLTTVVNASTAPLLVHRLGITAIPHAKRELLLFLHRQLVNHSVRMEHPEHIQKEMRKLMMETKEYIHSEQVDTSLYSYRHEMGAAVETLEHFVPMPIRRKTPGAKKTSAWSWLFCFSAAEASSGPGLKLADFDEAQDNGDLAMIVVQAQLRFEQTSEEDLRLLGDLPTMVSRSWVDDLVKNIKDAGVDVGMAKVVTETFLQLVWAHYWKLLEKGDLRPGSEEEELLMTSVRMAQGWKADLTDFKFIRSQLAMPIPRHKRSSVREIDKEKPSLILRIVLSTTFHVIIFSAILLNFLFIVIEMSVRSDSNNDHILWVVTEAFFTTIFTAEVALKMLQLRHHYFSYSWNTFEFALVVVSILGLALDVKGGVLRIALMFRALRLLRLFRLYPILVMLHARLQHKQLSEEVAKHMMTISALVCFIKAHLEAQLDFAKYFGTSHGVNDKRIKIDNPEVARCLLQSQLGVYQAIALAVTEERQLDRSILAEANAERQSKLVVQELEKFVLDAHKMGVIAARDVEAILEPLHAYIRQVSHIIEDCGDGIVPFDHTPSPRSSSSERVEEPVEEEGPPAHPFSPEH